MKALLALIHRRWPFVVLAIIAALHILKIIQVDGYGLGLLLLAFLPALLPVVAKYLKSFKVGKDGIEATIVADNEGIPAAEINERLLATNSKVGLANSKEVEFPYGIEARRVLATLWHFQKQYFSEDANQRWGFGVGSEASDFSEFLKGAVALEQAKLIFMTHGGLCYLTNEGIAFCKEHRATLEAVGPFYTQFAPAKEAG